MCAFSDIGTFFKGSGISKEQLSEDGTPCILYGELYTKYKSEVIREVKSKTAINTKGLVFSKANDVIIPSSGETAIDISTACCVTLDNVLLGGDLNVIRPHGHNGSFISYQLNERRKYDIAKVAQGIAIIHLYNESLKKIKVSVPTDINEENKIVALLSLLDARIETQSQIIKELESLIKRFSRTYHNSVEKKEYKISELGRPFRAMALSKDDLSIEGKKCILYGELFTKYDCVIDEVVSYTEDASANQTLSGENDLLFPASTTVDAVSLISPSAISIKNVILGGDLFGLRLHSGFNNEYVSYAINHIYKRELAKYAQGSTIVHLYYNDIKNVKLELPDLDAQNFFANLMRLLKSKIRNEQNLLSAYQKQKKYLLSQMFI